MGVLIRGLSIQRSTSKLHRFVPFSTAKRCRNVADHMERSDARINMSSGVGLVCALVLKAFKFTRIKFTVYYVLHYCRHTEAVVLRREKHTLSHIRLNCGHILQSSVSSFCIGKHRL